MAVLRSDLRDSLGGSEVFQEAPSLFWNRDSPKLTPVVANWILSYFVNHQLGMVEWQELGSYQQPAGETDFSHLLWPDTLSFHPSPLQCPSLSPSYYLFFSVYCLSSGVSDTLEYIHIVHPYGHHSHYSPCKGTLRSRHFPPRHTFPHS